MIALSQWLLVYTSDITLSTGTGGKYMNNPGARSAPRNRSNQ